MGGLLPAVRERGDGYVAWPAPLGEEEGKRAQAGGAEINAGREEMWALSNHRFQKHSELHSLWQRERSLYLVKLDKTDACGHTRIHDDSVSARTRATDAPCGAVARTRPRHSYRHRHSPPLGGDFAHAATRRRIRRLHTGEVRPRSGPGRRSETVRSRDPDLDTTLTTGEQSPGVALRAKTTDDVFQEVRA